METIYHLYSEIDESGIFCRIDSRKKESEIFISEGSRPRTQEQFISDYYIDGDDVYYQNQEDKQNDPFISYKKIDELENVYKYLSGPIAILLKNPFRDERGVMYANDGKTLVKAPDSLEGEYQCGEEVEVIFRRAFENCSKITKVILPSTLKEIGFAAFSNCNKLKVAELPEFLEKIGKHAFSSCALESAKIPSGVRKVPEGLFSSCHSLGHVELHDNIVELEGNAFESTNKLYELVLPKYIDSLGYIPFRWSSITKIVIPGTVKTVSGAAFYHSNNLCYVAFEEGVEELCDSFQDCKNLEYVILPKSLKKIDEDIFEGSSPLIFVPKGTIEQFRNILPERLKNGLREGDVPEELQNEVEKKIQSIILDASKAKDDCWDLLL